MTPCDLPPNFVSYFRRNLHCLIGRSIHRSRRHPRRSARWFKRGSRGVCGDVRVRLAMRVPLPPVGGGREPRPRSDPSGFPKLFRQQGRDRATRHHPSLMSWYGRNTMLKNVQDAWYCREGSCTTFRQTHTVSYLRWTEGAAQLRELYTPNTVRIPSSSSDFSKYIVRCCVP